VSDVQMMMSDPHGALAPTVPRWQRDGAPP